VKQLLQNLGSGALELVETPAPACGRGQLLIATTLTLVSAGTERMLVEFGKANVIAKARSQPDKVRQVLSKMKTDGIGATLDAVRSKLDQPLALGYCNVGTVLEVGAGVTGFSVGDRVLSNGAHAEIVRVPATLAARIPENVSDDDASFVVLASIGLQGLRLARPELGECFVVIGLGLIGMMTAQLLKAAGCRVMGVDLDPERCAMAKNWCEVTVALKDGADPLAAARAFSRGAGVDGVIITASTSSDVPVSQAADMCRQRGRIILVGVAGLKLSRDQFYKKELTFQVSSSYGPGRYDAAYEEKGQDYPAGFVRFTAQRNFVAVLDAMASGGLDVSGMVTHRYNIADAAGAYATLTSDAKALGILLRFRDASASPPAGTRTIALSGASPVAGTPQLAVIGAGNFASRVLIPALKSAGASIRAVATSSGVNAVHHGRKHGAEFATTDLSAVFDDPAVDAVVVATRHDSHAELVIRAIEAGKHVFVEKPLALNHGDVDRIEAAMAVSRTAGHAPMVMVGFNRRFAPHVVRTTDALKRIGEQPRILLMTMNAGEIPTDHWTQDMEAGGGRIIGECCHMIDLARHLAGSKIVSVATSAIGRSAGGPSPRDNAVVSVNFANGSLASIAYLAIGSKDFPKERIEVFAAGGVLQIDNFRKFAAYSWPGASPARSFSQDKGHVAGVAAFVAALKSGGPSPIPFDEIIEVARASIDAARTIEELTQG
jgi:predicted dehydrogenase/threonine dehydrogenase-like Zn-dependent dehydrogenase